MRVVMKLPRKSRAKTAVRLAQVADGVETVLALSRLLMIPLEEALAVYKTVEEAKDRRRYPDMETVVPTAETEDEEAV